MTVPGGLRPLDSRPVPTHHPTRSAEKRASGVSAPSGKTRDPSPPTTPNRSVTHPHQYDTDKRPPRASALPWTTNRKNTPNAEGPGLT
ncbi:hypothetical protein J2Z21_004675 [Streptomyces griseochromogenes]|uniref:Transposase n=1 Tax=Streptomyces griseochromogenes TaxID=68214 RepID=A0ABS4LWA3_9ACTN|nr:hypothetical protein [Streptomyces griseochromogenes]